MYHLAGLLVLVLISGEIDGAIRRKTAPNPAADTPWKNLEPAGARMLVEESRNAQITQQQQGGAAFSGMKTQYVDMGAAGYADLEVKLDMRAFLAQLQMIPTLGQAITNMGNKVESLLAYNTNQGAGFGNQILSLGKVLESRMDREDSKIETLIQMVQQLQTHAANVDSKLENLDNGITHVGNAFGSGTACDTSGLEGNIQNVLATLPQVGNMLEKLISQVNKNLDILQGNMQNGFGIVQRELTVLDTISKPGYLCPVPNGATKTETQILSSLANFEDLLSRFPQQIISTLPQIVGSRNETLKYISSLVENSHLIRSDIDGVRRQLLESKEDVKKFFAESQKSLQVVKKVVTETTQVVQSSAAAAISASRSLRCATKNQKTDLDD